MESTYIFDDGSTLNTSEGGSLSATPSPVYPGDVLDQVRMGGFVPANGGKPWWETVLQTGLPRVIDSHYKDLELQRLLASGRYPTGTGIVGASGATQPMGVFSQALGVLGVPPSLTPLLFVAGIAYLFLSSK